MLVVLLVLMYLHGIQPDPCDPRGSSHVCADAVPPGSLAPVQGAETLPPRLVRFGVDFAPIRTNPLGLSASCLVATEAMAPSLCEQRP